ncbi:hypothetical protein CP533_6748 [Ophiocordyceps camponoti-saundersi (nom. inval.)]|nr:hypothetical protein CP533_6748 [Ophiocordyceps camponoti-saundersi (nom. inval.)]
MPTRVQRPSSDDDASVDGSPIRNGRSEASKRKRTDVAVNGQSSRRRRRSSSETDHREMDDDIYDPDQPLEERRTVQRSYRDLMRDLTEKGDEYLGSDSNGLHETILKADELSKKLRQTTEATIDSRLLVSTTDLSYRKALRLTQGSLSQGIDPDELVSKCISYMRNGAGIADSEAPELSSTQRQRRRAPRNSAADHDDIGDDGDMMNWSHLGRYACLPYLRRPALSGFLLGPLSVEKKARKISKRSAPFRPNNLTETRPEVLSVEDLAQKENDLTAICSKILQQLLTIQTNTQEIVAELIEDDMDDAEKTRIMHQHGLRSTGGLDLMRFVVNPLSFAQTVENIFYVSFLIRDGRLQIELDEDGLPSLAPVAREADDEGATRHGASKHQAVLSIDMKTWRDMVQTLNLTEPMIENRREAASSGPGARSWYC